MMRGLLHGTKVKLNSLRESDIPTVTEWYQDVEFLRHLDAKPAAPNSEDLVRELVEGAKKKSPNSYGFAIRQSETNELLGILLLEAILWNHGTCYIALEIGDKQQRGQGYGREAMSLALDFAFNELNLHRIALTVFAYNTPAIRLYEGLGFTREGAHREFLHRDGQRYDLYLYGILRREWEAQQKGTLE